jgi:hypothetical protein
MTNLITNQLFSGFLVPNDSRGLVFNKKLSQDQADHGGAEPERLGVDTLVMLVGNVSGHLRILPGRGGLNSASLLP